MRWVNQDRRSSPPLIAPGLLPPGLQLQQLRLVCHHLVFEDVALDLHSRQQTLQLLHPLAPLLRTLLRLLQTLRLFGQTNPMKF